MLALLNYAIIGFGSGVCALLVFVGIGCTVRPKATEPVETPRVQPQSQPPLEPPAPAPATKQIAERKSPPAPSVPEGPLAFDGLTNTLSNDYANNPDRADARCKDKRVRVKGRIDHIGQREGLVVLGYSSTRDSTRPLEATVVFALPKGTNATELAVKPGQIAVIEGTCRGRVEDGAPRASGQTYHIRIEACKLVSVETETR